MVREAGWWWAEAATAMEGEAEEEGAPRLLLGFDLRRHQAPRSARL